jgi:excisionase family DNA binding protein
VKKVELLTAEELGRQLRIPKTTVYDLARKRKIPSAFKVGKHWRFSKDRIYQWIEEQTEKDDNRQRKSM